MITGWARCILPDIGAKLKVLFRSKGHGRGVQQGQDEIREISTVPLREVSDDPWCQVGMVGEGQAIGLEDAVL